MYSSFTSKIGFKTNEEGKTMGLAPYGTSRIYNKLKQELIFNKKKYDLGTGKKLISKKFFLIIFHMFFQIILDY